MPELHIGTHLQSQESFHFDSELLKYHIALLGATGSGKTVAAKVIIEEAAMAGIPSIIVDPQGDLGRLAMLADFDEIRENGGDVELAKKFSQEVEVRIWTPTKKSGLPLYRDLYQYTPKKRQNVLFVFLFLGEKQQKMCNISTIRDKKCF